MPEERKYILAIKRNNNDYVPLELQVTSFYNGADLTTLEGIDSFTSKLKTIELLSDALQLNLISPTENFLGFSIIYSEKNKIRELKDGPIFEDEPVIYPGEEIIDYILSKSDDKKTLNKIYNICSSIKTENKNLEFFKFALNNLDLFFKKNQKAPRIALEIFFDLPYEIKRTILINISSKVISASNPEIDIHISHNKKYDGEASVA